MTTRQSTTISTRECNECTACCEGWHTSNIRGRDMYPGRPCHFFSNKCTIYDFRPQSCKVYRCAWLTDDKSEFPEWFRPDISGVICDWRDSERGTYLEVREMGKPIETRVLSWIYEYGAQRGLCMRIQVNGQWHTHGNEEFMSQF